MALCEWRKYFVTWNLGWNSFYLTSFENILFLSIFFSGHSLLQAASELIKASVEPVLEQYRPVVFAALTFSKLTLGTVAPQFTGRYFQIILHSHLYLIYTSICYDTVFYCLFVANTSFLHKLHWPYLACFKQEYDTNKAYNNCWSMQLLDIRLCTQCLPFF
jgi:hypothetical protein